VNASSSRSAYNLAVKRDVAEILNEALMLPLNEREALAKSLVASLAPHAGANHTDPRVSSNVGRLYEQARDRALARLRDGIDLQWTPADCRDDLHRR
jgi:hypothetical protein